MDSLFEFVDVLALMKPEINSACINSTESIMKSKNRSLEENISLILKLLK
jgi:hypothetical protein